MGRCDPGRETKHVNVVISFCRTYSDVQSFVILFKKAYMRSVHVMRCGCGDNCSSLWRRPCDALIHRATSTYYARSGEWLQSFAKKIKLATRFFIYCVGESSTLDHHVLYNLEHKALRTTWPAWPYWAQLTAQGTGAACKKKYVET